MYIYIYNVYIYMNKKPVCVCVPQRHNSASSGPGSEIVLPAATVVIVQVEAAVVPVWVMKNVVIKNCHLKSSIFSLHTNCGINGSFFCLMLNIL